MGIDISGRTILTLAVIALVGVLGAPDLAGAQASGEQIQVTASSGANIRTGASTSHPVLTTIPVNTILPVLQRQGDWFLVRLSAELGTSAESGFIHHSTVDVLAAPSPTATVAPAVERPPVDQTPTADPPRDMAEGATDPQRDVAEGAAAGARAGGSKSVVMPGIYAGTTSLLFPGAGLLYLLLMNTGEVQPSFAEQAYLRDKSQEHVIAWTEGYDRALTGRQKRAILVGTAVGSVAALLIWNSLASSSSF